MKRILKNWLLKTGLPLMKNVLKPLAKSILTPLRLTAVASVSDVNTQKKMCRLRITTLIISNQETDDIMKITNLLKNLAY